MPIQVLMPALSPTMEKGNLAKWLKKEGDAVKSGDVIAEIETDKATMEVEAVDEGTLGKILVPEGTADVAVNTPIAVLLGEGEDASAHQGRRRRRASQQPAAAAIEQPEDQKVEESRAPVGEGARRQQGAREVRRAEPPEPEHVARAGRAGRHRDGDQTVREALARRHGRGDAPRPQRSS